MVAPLDLHWQTFGKLQARHKTGEVDSQRRVLWFCVCECGERKIANASDLRRGRVRSCGCLVVPPVFTSSGRREPCKAPGCDSRTSPEGDYCAKHRRRLDRHGSPLVCLSVDERLEAARQGWARRKSA